PAGEVSSFKQPDQVDSSSTEHLHRHLEPKLLVHLEARSSLNDEVQIFMKLARVESELLQASIVATDTHSSLWRVELNDPGDDKVAHVSNRIFEVTGLVTDSGLSR